MVMQAYAVIMVAKNKIKMGVSNSETFEQSFQNENTRKYVCSSSLTPIQLIIAENIERAEENIDHLMSRVLSSHSGYEDHAFSIGDISENISHYFDTCSSDIDWCVNNFYLIGGWIFVQQINSPSVIEILVAWSSNGKSKKDATTSFLKQFDGQKQMQQALRVGHSLSCQKISIQDLAKQYVFQTPCSTYH